VWLGGKLKLHFIFETSNGEIEVDRVMKRRLNRVLGNFCHANGILILFRSLSLEHSHMQALVDLSLRIASPRIVRIYCWMLELYLSSDCKMLATCFEMLVIPSGTLIRLF
jgi:hypothetical protein